MPDAVNEQQREPIGKNSPLTLDISADAFNDIPMDLGVKLNSLGYLHRRLHHFQLQRTMQHLPNASINFKAPEDIPNYYFKRFTSNGQYLLAFSGDSRLLALATQPRDLTNRPPKTFEQFFHSPVTFDVAECEGYNATVLSKDFCLCIDDDLFIIAATMQAAIGDYYPRALVYNTTESALLSSPSTCLKLPALDHTTFYTVSLSRRKVIDRFSIKYDLVYLSHHQGVSLQDRTFSLFLLKSQAVISWDIDERGHFTHLQCFFSAPIPLPSKLPENFRNITVELNAESISGCFLDSSQPGGTLLELLLAYFGRDPLVLPMLQSLHLWRHQSLDRRHFLVRLATAETILATQPNHQSAFHSREPFPAPTATSFIAIYDMHAKCFVAVYNSADERLTNWIMGNWPFLVPESTLETVHALWDSIERSMRRALKTEGAQVSVLELRRRFTNILPLSPQSLQFALSPWFNDNLVHFESRLRWPLGRCQPIPLSLLQSNGVASFRIFSMNSSSFFELSFPHEEELGVAPAEAIDRHRWFNIILHPSRPIILIAKFGVFRSHSLQIYYNNKR